MKLFLAIAIFLLSATLITQTGVTGSNILPETSSSSLDGTGSAIACNTLPSTNSPFLNCLSDSISTSQTGDLILVLAQCGYGSCNDNVSSVFDQTGLNFLQRVTAPPNGQLMEYYAVAKTALTGDNVTVAFYRTSHCCFMEMIVLAVSGVNQSAAFDPAVSPSTSVCNGPCSANVSTSTSDLIIASVSIDDGQSCTLQPGFTVVETPYYSQANALWDLYYEPVATAGTAGFSCDSQLATAIFVDAINVGGSSISPDPPSPSGGMGGKPPIPV